MSLRAVPWPALPPAGRKHLLNALNMKSGWPMPPFMGPFDFDELMHKWREGGWMRVPQATALAAASDWK